MNPDLERHIRESFSRQGMMATFGAELRALERGACTIAAPIRPLASQQHGYGHAALTFGLGDTAAGYAALSTLDAGREVLTVEMKINLMNPACGAELVATGRVVKQGRRLIVVTAEVTAGERVVALLQGTMIPV